MMGVDLHKSRWQGVLARGSQIHRDFGDLRHPACYDRGVFRVIYSSWSHQTTGKYDVCTHCRKSQEELYSLTEWGGGFDILVPCFRNRLLWLGEKAVKSSAVDEEVDFRMPLRSNLQFARH